MRVVCVYACDHFSHTFLIPWVICFKKLTLKKKKKEINTDEMQKSYHYCCLLFLLSNFCYFFLRCNRDPIVCLNEGEEKE